MGYKMNEETKIDKMESVKYTQRNSSSKKYKTEVCKVLKYDSSRKVLNILFKTYGIQIANVQEHPSDYITIRYSGEIGKSNFSYEIAKE